MTLSPNVYLAAVVSACATSLATLPLWRKWCLRSGLMDEPGHRKIHEQAIPLAGGLTVMGAILLPILLASLLLGWQNTATAVSSSPAQGTHPALLDTYSAFLLKYGLGRRATELLGIFLGAFGILLVGWLDDKHELRPASKFAGQLLVSILVIVSGARITLFVPNVFFSYGITLLWMLTVMNAFNFIDNMNGLCAGLGAIGAFYFALIAAENDQYLVALIAFLILGALLGFLPYNFPRARAFLGDAGSHLVGYWLAVLAILPHFYTPRHPRRLAVLIPLLVLAVPLLDLLWVVVRRWRIGQPVYVGDTNHLSHRLVRMGLTPARAVLLLWTTGAVFGALALLLVN